MLLQLAVINHNIVICSAYAKQNVVEETAGDLKHFLNVSTLDIF